ncbi:Uncharacterized membrane protein YqaE, homolog of Blt101, UPF0057 family [Arboricoccus pini]|uniref:Uncharacterized membrane protein YqaE, homolog of Blt101, UPF0057 family n=1 Tax=Arboricoccus pini TaxID=1963835 RepID=A0A212R0A2_9PROT|nr:YqaE/Pmp3 family membrane protein [Arboricoccus pini]SNB65389.1 Uncharacterized membrane protein YqaE, homolog of Blt101, UPF0057 family [Arboricoccus pini]
MLLTILLCPPIAVYWTVGAGQEFSLNVMLTLLGYLPGIIHAAYIVSTHWPTHA